MTDLTPKDINVLKEVLREAKDARYRNRIKEPMTEPNFRAVAQELFDQLSAYDGCDDVEEVSQHWNYTNCNELLHRARTALSTPPAEPPTDEELLKLTENVSTKHLYAYKSLPSNWDFGDYCSSPQGLIDFARAVLERWGNKSNT